MEGKCFFQIVSKRVELNHLASVGHDYSLERRKQLTETGLFPQLLWVSSRTTEILSHRAVLAESAQPESAK